MPFCHEWDEARALPKDLFKKCAQAGFLAGVLGAPWPKEYADYPIAGGVTHAEVKISFFTNFPKIFFKF